MIFYSFAHFFTPFCLSSLSISAFSEEILLQLLLASCTADTPLGYLKPHEVYSSICKFAHQEQWLQSQPFTYYFKYTYSYFAEILNFFGIFSPRKNYFQTSKNIIILNWQFLHLIPATLNPQQLNSAPSTYEAP